MRTDFIAASAVWVLANFSAERDVRVQVFSRDARDSVQVLRSQQHPALSVVVVNGRAFGGHVPVNRALEQAGRPAISRENLALPPALASDAHRVYVALNIW